MKIKGLQTVVKSVEAQKGAEQSLISWDKLERHLSNADEPENREIGDNISTKESMTDSSISV